MRNLIILILILSGLQSFAQSDNRIVRKGNKQYDNGKYKDAEINYRKALEKNPTSIKGVYNLANSLYKQDSYEEAVKNYQGTIAKLNSNNRMEQAAAYHNLGNAYLKSEKYQEAIDAYKQSLRINPDDNDTRYNLSYALNKLAMNQNQSEGGSQKKDNNDENKEQQQSSQSDNNQQQNQNQSNQNKPQISKRDAERMLQALNNDEQKTLDKVNKQKVKQIPAQPEKDW